MSRSYFSCGEFEAPVLVSAPGVYKRRTTTWKADEMYKNVTICQVFCSSLFVLLLCTHPHTATCTLTTIDFGSESDANPVPFPDPRPPPVSPFFPGERYTAPDPTRHHPSYQSVFAMMSVVHESAHNGQKRGQSFPPHIHKANMTPGLDIRAKTAYGHHNLASDGRRISQSFRFGRRIIRDVEK